ncbi:MAG: type II toxin-antitoxin system Phd/YefM family antitoxin, partial [Rhodospirillaceae bacterium]|nr:type II toxin-antitoxin system Phd/YefM family antitoxin [Rhodospirillaceae bacterium]
LRDGAQDGVSVIVAKIDASGIAGIHEPVNGGRAMHRRGGGKAGVPLPQGEGDSAGELALSQRNPISGTRLLARARVLIVVANLANFAPMKRIAAKEAKNRFGTLPDAAQGGPVCVTRKGRAGGVMMSMPHYERLRGAVWERLTATMDALGEKASANGLTEARLEALLADES